MPLTVADVMTPLPCSVSPEQPLRAAYFLMLSRGIRHLPVIRDGAFEGIISDRDLRRAFPSVLMGAQQSEFEYALRHIPVSQVMTRSPVTVSPGLSLRSAIDKLLQHRFSSLPVVEDGALIGIVTQTDCLRTLSVMLASRPQFAAGAPATAA